MHAARMGQNGIAASPVMPPDRIICTPRVRGGERQREILRCGKCPPAVKIGADGAEHCPMRAATAHALLKYYYAAVMLVCGCAVPRRKKPCPGETL